MFRESLLVGQLASVTKNANKGKLDEAHEELFETYFTPLQTFHCVRDSFYVISSKEFRTAADDEELTKAMAAATLEEKPTATPAPAAEVKKEEPKKAEVRQFFLESVIALGDAFCSSFVCILGP